MPSKPPTEDEAKASPAKHPAPPAESAPAAKQAEAVKPDIRPARPEGYHADGLTAADEQRARSAWIEAHGMKAWLEATEDKVEPAQVPGVRSTAKDEMKDARR